MTSGIIRKRLLFLFLCISITPLWAGETKTDYLAIMVSGQKIGHAVHSRSEESSHVITTDELTMTLGRAGQSLTVYSRETHVETTEGEPVSFETLTKTSGIEQVTSGTVQGDKLTVKRQLLGQTAQQVVDWPEGALLNEGMRLVQMERGLHSGDQFEISAFRPELLAAVTAQTVVGEMTEIDLFGRVVELTEVKTTMLVSGEEIVSTSYVNDELDALKTVIPMLGMNLELIACDKSFAMREDDIVDFLEKLSIASPTQLISLNTTDSITYIITPTTDQGLSLPTSSHQKVEKQEDGTLQLTVRRIAPSEGVQYPYSGSYPQILEALKPTEILQCDDENIIELAKHAVAGTEDTAKAAKQIESFVAGYIQKKDLSVGYASAAEVAQNRQGDCSEHAVLTAAMCRSVGIPARVVCGVLYVDSFANQNSIFAGHMWVEAFIDGQWIGLDATRVEQGFGPGHIALAYGNGDPSDFFSLINTLGCFKIESISMHKAETDTDIE